MFVLHGCGVLACVGVAALLVGADEKYVRVFQEGVVRPIPMVHVKIEYQNLRIPQLTRTRHRSKVTQAPPD